MADEPNIPRNTYYQRRGHYPLAKNESNRRFIFDSAVQRIKNDFGYVITAIGNAFSAYAANGFTPPLVLDFVDAFYGTGSETSTLDAATTYTGASLSTMTDSDGLLKWAPHNLQVYSENLLGGSWVGEISAADRITYTTTDTSRSFAALYNGADYFSSGVTYNMSATFTVDDGLPVVALGAYSAGARYGWAAFDTSTETDLGSYTLATIGGFSVVECVNTSGNIWQLTVRYVCTTSGTLSIHLGAAGQTAAELGTAGVGTGSCGVTNIHAYRSDLGGMVDNPETASSYVPTTGSTVYLPRVGNHVYNGSTYVNEGLLLESEARTNLVAYSEDFTDASWTKSNSTVTGDADVSPSGQGDADRLTENTANSTHFMYSSAATAGTNNFSVFAKKGTQDFICLTLQASNGNHAAQVFDLTNGTVGETNLGGTSGVVENAFVEDFGNGWYRCSAAITLSGSFAVLSLASAKTGNSFDASGRPAYLGASKYISVYGAQLELGSTPSSYIPTAGSTATRAAETLTVAAADMPWNPLAVSIQMDGTMTYADTNTGTEARFIDWTADASNSIQNDMTTVSGRTGRLSFSQEALGVSDKSADDGSGDYTPDINVPFNIASRHGSTFINGAVDGRAFVANTTPTALPDLSATDFGIGTVFMGNIGKVRVWADDIGDTGIAEAST